MFLTQFKHMHSKSSFDNTYIFIYILINILIWSWHWYYYYYIYIIIHDNINDKTQSAWKPQTLIYQRNWFLKYFCKVIALLYIFNLLLHVVLKLAVYRLIHERYIILINERVNILNNSSEIPVRIYIINI